MDSIKTKEELIEWLDYLEKNKNNFEDEKVLEFCSRLRWRSPPWRFASLTTVIEEVANKKNSFAEVLMFYSANHDNLSWLRKASENNNAYAQYILGMFYERIEEKKTSLLLQSATNGCLYADIQVTSYYRDDEKRKKAYFELYNQVLKHRKHYLTEIGDIESRYPMFWDEFLANVTKLEEENERLKEENEELRTALYYAPGNDGAKEAEDHFDGLVEKLKNEKS